MLDVIVVTHNSANCLQGLLQSLVAYPPQCVWKLIVVDNRSTDSSVPMVRESCPDATVVIENRNHGFAHAVNIGASRSQADYLLLANPDIAWDTDRITPLIEFMDSHPRVAAVAPRLVFPDGRAQPSIRRFPSHANIWFSRRSPLRHLADDRYTVADPKEPRRVEAVAATCLLVRTEAFRAVGGMDPGYFLYVEDTDICRRWADAGWEVWTHPHVPVSHRWTGEACHEERLRYHHRAGIRRYFQKHHPTKHLRNMLLFSALGLAGLWSRLNRPAAESEAGTET